jgi:hypothetical protein
MAVEAFSGGGMVSLDVEDSSGGGTASLDFEEVLASQSSSI